MADGKASVLETRTAEASFAARGGDTFTVDVTAPTVTGKRCVGVTGYFIFINDYGQTCQVEPAGHDGNVYHFTIWISGTAPNNRLRVVFLYE